MNHTPPEIFYRLYHDDQGRPLAYSMEAAPGTYIEITAEQYQRSSFLVRVRQGKIEPIEFLDFHKLVPNGAGQSCHAQDVTVISTDINSIKWSPKHETY